MADMFCQQCRTPLKLHGSLQNLNPAAVNLLQGSTSKPASTGASKQTVFDPRPHPSAVPSRNPARRDVYDQAQKNDAHPVVRRSYPNAPKTSSPLAGGGSIPADPTDSFVLLSDSVVIRTPQPTVGEVAQSGGTTPSHLMSAGAPEDSLSHKMQTSRRLFDMLSARSDVDYPICGECTQLLVEGLQGRLSEATKSRDGYQQFLKRLQAEIPTDEEAQRVEEELLKARQEKEAALAELEALEREKVEIEEEIAAAEAESKRLELDEEDFWQERNAFALQLEEFQSEKDSVNLRFEYDSKQLERLHRTNVYNDTFCISHDGYFGTINGLRLGKLPQQPVEWTEINAAWGQTLLLLHTVADKLGFTFENYRLKPMGSTSKIEKIEHRQADGASRLAAVATGLTSKSDIRIQSLELFSSGTIPMGHLFAHRKFDGAMVAFLDCIKQLGDFVFKSDPNAVLPYPIVKDKIGDVSIRLTFNQDELWTKACKYTLTCSKFLLACASNQTLARRLQQQAQPGPSTTR